MGNLTRFVLVLAIAANCFAASPEKKTSKKIWLLSAAVLIAASFADAHTSLGRPEANPLLRNSQGGFSGARAVALKSAAVGGTLALQICLTRSRPELRRTSSYVNFGAAAALAAAAAHNSR
jgi:hypothetical protein